MQNQRFPATFPEKRTRTIFDFQVWWTFVFPRTWSQSVSDIGKRWTLLNLADDFCHDIPVNPLSTWPEVLANISWRYPLRPIVYMPELYILYIIAMTYIYIYVWSYTIQFSYIHIHIYIYMQLYCIFFIDESKLAPGGATVRRGDVWSHSGHQGSQANPGVDGRCWAYLW